MTWDPLRRIPTTWRLWLAATLCVASLAQIWQRNIAGTFVCVGYGYNYLGVCVPEYLPDRLTSTTVVQSPLRVFLFAGIVLLAICAARPRTGATRRLGRIATAAIAIGAVSAAAHGASSVLVILLGALALAAPPAWSRPRRALLAEQPPAR